ncbi:unnamed protein product [Anisakis simplex]|uniref:SCY1-like protein 2 (inferred by orthology to a human protein) n=1 Tax=Anisakis simplex TaxID=6269 RepID=A0A158PMU8_ANISI|nr:unnamed protein product [Anisakis simplex]
MRKLFYNRTDNKNGSKTTENWNTITLRQQSYASLPPCTPASNPPTPAITPLHKHYHRFTFRTLSGHWKLFSAKSILSDKEASVFIFEKKFNVKAPPRIGRINRLTLVDLIKYDVTQLTSLAHPRILHVLHPLEENKEMLTFATERIHANLETIVADKGMDNLEMRLGILQIIDGLSYLHNSVKVLHGNLTPSSIYVTASRLWKIAGFAFSVSAKEPLPAHLQPELDFLAPEYLAPNQHTVTPAADVFSLGVLICWICTGGKKLIDARNNIETHAIVCGQLDTALQCIAEELGANLLDAMQKVLSLVVEQRPNVQLLALLKYFDDPILSTLRQLDDIAQEFDPAHKSLFLSQTLFNNLPRIPENLWFTRILQRFNEHLLDSHELYSALSKPLFYMLDHCESHNIHKLRPWMRRIVDHAQQKTLMPLILENMALLFKRLADDKIEDQLQDLIITCIKSDDIHTQGQAVQGIPAVAEFLPNWFIARRLLPAFEAMNKFVHNNISRQLDVLACIAALSDRCDWNMLQLLISTISLCDMQHHAIIHAKSRLVQRILTCDASRLRDRSVICNHLLNPLTLGLALNDLSIAHFDDVLSTIRILIDIVEQLRYESNEQQQEHSCALGRMGSRRVSMSSSHLPRVMITAARPSFSGYDSRKMSFLSADGRLEDRGRRESKDSHGSLESDISSRMGNGSDISDEQNASSSGREGRRKSWLEGYLQSCSLEQNSSQLDATTVLDSSQRVATDRRSERRARTRSPAGDSNEKRSQPTRPNSFTNLGHNLVRFTSSFPA